MIGDILCILLFGVLPAWAVITGWREARRLEREEPWRFTGWLR